MNREPSGRRQRLDEATPEQLRAVLVSGIPRRLEEIRQFLEQTQRELALMSRFVEDTRTLLQGATPMDSNANVTATAKPATDVALLLTEPEAAKYLGISSRKLWNLAAAGEIPTVPVGRLKRYDRRDLVAYVDRVKQAHHTKGDAEASAA